MSLLLIMVPSRESSLAVEPLFRSVLGFTISVHLLHILGSEVMSIERHYFMYIIQKLQ